ncbi:MAG: glutathione synthase [Deltaproteobacteria bacterium]|nr:glutathione synthase [Deltaproteobacteria bacterium]
MGYRLLFIIDPIAGLLPDKDTSFVFMLEAQRRAYAVYTCGPGDLFVRSSRPYSKSRRTHVERTTPHYSLFEEREEPLDWFHAIFMRKDPPVDQAYTFAVQILDLVPPSTTFVMNRPRGLLVANEKLYALNFPEFIPDTLITSDINRLDTFLDQLGGEMIIKPLDGCGGAGIFFVQRSDRNLRSLLETATANQERLIVAQQYLPAVRHGDKRVIVLDGQPLGAILRVPQERENRGNIHAGGICRATTLSTEERRIVDGVGTRLHEDGLYFVGLDLIGERLTEVNVTSPTGIQEINTFDATQLEVPVLDFVESQIPKRLNS